MRFVLRIKTENMWEMAYELEKLIEEKVKREEEPSTQETIQRPLWVDYEIQEGTLRQECKGSVEQILKHLEGQ